MPGLARLVECGASSLGSISMRSRHASAVPSRDLRFPTVVLLALGTVAGLMVGCAPRVAVTQPIAFSHAAHLKEEGGLECKTCHRGAENDRQAGLAPLANCAACHRRIVPDHPEVAKLLAAYQEKKPVRWQRVNVLPASAMVQFRHAPHTRAGVGCEACHGDVATMTVAEPVIDVARMGWCIDCHRENGATDDCMACHY